MKKTSISVLTCIFLIAGANASNGADCFFKGIPLKGKVKFVEYDPDIKIKFVRLDYDIRVKFVNGHTTRCGEWRIVESWQDFTVKVVERYPDIKVRIDNYPGLVR